MGGAGAFDLQPAGLGAIGLIGYGLRRRMARRSPYLPLKISTATSPTKTRNAATRVQAIQALPVLISSRCMIFSLRRWNSRLSS